MCLIALFYVPKQIMSYQLKTCLHANYINWKYIILEIIQAPVPALPINAAMCKDLGHYSGIQTNAVLANKDRFHTMSSYNAYHYYCRKQRPARYNLTELNRTVWITVPIFIIFQPSLHNFIYPNMPRSPNQALKTTEYGQCIRSWDRTKM